jgi:hypothetical protein
MHGLKMAYNTCICELIPVISDLFYLQSSTLVDGFCYPTNIFLHLHITRIYVQNTSIYHIYFYSNIFLYHY